MRLQKYGFFGNQQLFFFLFLKKFYLCAIKSVYYEI